MSKISKRMLSARFRLSARFPTRGARSVRPVTDNRSMTNNHIFVGKRRGFKQTFEAHVVTQTLPVLTQLITQISSWGRPPDRPAGPGRPYPLYRSHSGSKHPHLIGETLWFEQTFKRALRNRLWLWFVRKGQDAHTENYRGDSGPRTP